MDVSARRTRAFDATTRFKMGVNGLWPLLQASSRAIEAADLEGKFYAVDLSLWLIQAASSPRLVEEHRR